jgi:N-terminal domain of galactosyltransferase
MSIPVLVPRRLDLGWRDKSWAYLRHAYWNFQPGYRIVEGYHHEGPFNRSAAINTAANIRYWDDVAVVADSDSFVSEDQLTQAVRIASQTGKMVSPFTFVVQLSQPCTENLVAGGVLTLRNLEAEHVRTKPIETQSNILVVPRKLWDEIGGFDERFVGWGGEDNAFWRACQIRRKEVIRLPGACFHLWHVPASDRNARMKDPQYLSNLALVNRYMRCQTKVDLRAVLDVSTT